MNLWKHSPAFYLSLLVLIGVVSLFCPVCLFLTLFFKKRLFWLVPIGTLFYVKLLCPHLPEEDIGKGQIHIEEVKRHVSSFNTSLVYIGKAITFHGKKGTYRRLPVRIYVPLSKQAPPADKDYLIEGTLKKVSFGSYVLKSPKASTWTPIEKTKSWAKWRYASKARAKKWIASRFKQKKVRLLMCALTTGHLESPFMAYTFNAVGLQHLLAVSGFHFALLSFWLAFLLKWILPEKGLALSLIFLLTLYFFYMGNAPSIQRAWIAVFIHFFGIFLNWRPSPLNSLGVGLLTALIFDPLVLFHIGLQLSFAATLGILLFYRPIERSLQAFFPKRPFKDLLTMPRLDQWGYLLCAYLRSALALEVATLPFSLPLLFAHFEVFPLLSLFYNLFFPLLFSILLVLFLLHLDWLVSPFASFLLMLIENAPKRLLFSVTFLETIGIGFFLALLALLKNRTRARALALLKKFRPSILLLNMKKCPRRDSNTRPVA